LGVERPTPGSDDEHPSGNSAVPIPTELFETVVAATSELASALQDEATKRREWDKHIGRLPDARESLEERKEASDALYQAVEGAGDRKLAAQHRVTDAVSEVEGFFIDLNYEDDEDEFAFACDNEDYRRACAVATCRPGSYAVVVSGATDAKGLLAPRIHDFAEDTVAPYLVGRLGYTEKGAASAITRIRHVSSEIVLDGVDLDDAVRIKLEITALGCKAEVVEGRARPAPQQGREPIPEAVRGEVWRRDQGRCVDCGSRQRLEYDHIIAVVNGGSNTSRNIELRCESCNRRKGARI
jgi:HNH endonuclease